MWTRRIEIMGRGIEGGAFESSKVELFLKILPKAWYFSNGEVSKFKGGINELEK